MSNPNLDDLRRDYRFRRELAPRCESCRHLVPLPDGTKGLMTGPDAECRLLDIVVRDARKSVCPGYQASIGPRREAARG